MKRLQLRLLIAALPIGGLVGQLSPAHAGTLTVSSTADNTTAGNGLCTLREAVQEASLTAGAGPFECGTPTLGGSDTIVMGAAVAGATLTLLNPITLNGDGAVIIQGADIVIDAAGLGFGFIILSDQNQLRDFSLRNALTGIEVRSTADGTILGGATWAERLELDDNDTFGIRIDGGNDTTIRQTRIADSDTNIQLEAGSDGVMIRNSILGMDPGGVASSSPFELGIYVAGGSSITIRNNVIGDGGFGILIFGGDGIVVRTNFVGTNVFGTAARHNSTGIFVQAATNVEIGGPTRTTGNLISGNDLGIGVVAVDGVQITNNLIGTNLATTGIIENGDGININRATNTTLSQNVIGGQRHTGVFVDSTSTATFTANLIGTNGALADLPNGRLTGGGLAIAGVATLSGNTIAFHDELPTSTGIYVYDSGSILPGSTGNCISGNSVGLMDSSTGDIDVSENYWGDPGGPTILPMGAVFGDSIDERDAAGLLDYSAHLASSSVVCP